MEYHPDRIQSKGMTPELASAAEEKFKDIQHAWDVIEKQRK
jgi:DnaJ like chaperone protein